MPHKIEKANAPNVLADQYYQLSLEVSPVSGQQQSRLPVKHKRVYVTFLEAWWEVGAVVFGSQKIEDENSEHESKEPV